MIERVGFGIFLTISLACRGFAPELIWAEPHSDALAQTIDVIEFSAALTAALTLAKVLLMYARFRPDYITLSDDLRGSRQFSTLAWAILRRLATSLFFAAIVVVAQLREPMRPVESWFDFALLSVFIYMSVGALLGILKFLPLFARTSR